MCQCCVKQHVSTGCINQICSLRFSRYTWFRNLCHHLNKDIRRYCCCFKFETLTLQVIFVGEEAVDAGGVRKEFFLLIMKELLDPKYGMFRYYEESRLIWFSNKVLHVWLTFVCSYSWNIKSALHFKIPWIIRTLERLHYELALPVINIKASIWETLSINIVIVLVCVCFRYMRPINASALYKISDDHHWLSFSDLRGYWLI